MSARDPAALPAYPAPVPAPVNRLSAEWQRLRLYVGGTLLAVCFALFGWQIWRGREPAPVAVQTLALGTDTGTDTGTAAGTGTSTGTGARPPAGAEIRVQVAGSVVHPGVYRLAAGDRVEDAVRAAGGFADGADTGRVNLAQRLRDEQRIDVPALGDESRPGAQPGTTGAPAGGTRQPGGAAPAGSAGPLPEATPRASGSGGVTPASATGQPPPARVNVNTATADELERLPGIGAVSARRILAYRQTKGPIVSLDQLHDAGVPETVVRRAAALLAFE